MENGKNIVNYSRRQRIEWMVLRYKYKKHE